LMRFRPMSGRLVDEETAFSELARVCSALRATTKRLEKREIISTFLKRLRTDEVSGAVLLIIGRIFPESEGRALNVGWATLKKVLEGGRQATLIESPLTILEVQRGLSEVAAASGPESVKSKRRLLEALLGRASKEEKEVILQNIFGEMRHGVNEGVMLEALADASGSDMDTARLANMLSGDLGLVATTAMSGGSGALQSLGLKLFTPIKPMLAMDGGNASEALAVHGGRTAVEFKFDGARIQIHKRGGEVRIFSRRLTDVTDSVPEIVSLARTFGGESMLVEGEVVAVDQGGKPLPFQDLMRRFRRVHDIDTAMKEIPLQLHLFDILYLDGRLLIGEEYEVRRARLASVVPESLIAKRIIASTVEEAESFLHEALDLGHEGLMAKRLDSKYVPGKRGKLWLKIKPADTLDLVILAAEWGSGRRQGWLSNYHLAVRAEEGFAMIGKTFKGLTDEEFKWITNRLQELRVSEERWGVRVKPELVVEVDYNEIQKSPHYESGYALRFARIKRIREDKGPADADTYERLEQLYEKQFERKGRIAEP